MIVISNFRASVFVCLSLLISVAHLDAQESPSGQPVDPGVSDANNLHQRLLGAWLLAGEPDTTSEPEAGARMRFFGIGHWLITESDPESGDVIYHHGGTYTLQGDTLTAKTTFATKPTARMIGQEKKFKVSVDGRTYTQIGLDNPWSESWRRAE